jgi:hypothetical protein
MSSKTYVSVLPKCDFCASSGVVRKAKYDFRTKWGQWANGCTIHWINNRKSETLGTGYGQELVEGEEPERSDDDIRADAMAAIEAGDFDAFEEAIGDRDPAEFL